MDHNSGKLLNPAGPTLLPVMTFITFVVAAYFVLAGCIYLFQLLAERSGIGWLQFGGLIVDIALLISLGTILNRRNHPLRTIIGPLVALLTIVLVFAVADWLMHGERASFWSMRNVRTMAVQSSTIAVAALGMTTIIIAGGIDLSVGTTIALCATVLAYGLQAGWGTAVAILVCLFTGFVAGSLNGALSSLLGVVPFIITLGTMTIYLGLGKFLANQTTIRPPLNAVPDWLPLLVTPLPNPRWIWEPLVPNFGSGVWLVLLLAALLAGLLHLTVFGRHVFAIGSNETAARLCGINVNCTKILIYALAGIFVGVAGIYQFARLSSGTPTAGAGMELRIIAAVVIGGGSLTGGRGSIAGTLVGAALMLVIASGCTALGVQNPLQDIIIGAIIVAAVTLDQFRRRHMFC